MPAGVHYGLYKALKDGEEIGEEDARRYRRYKVMKAMGWTLPEYKTSPSWLVDEIAMFLATEARARADKMEEMMER